MTSWSPHHTQTHTHTYIQLTSEDNGCGLSAYTLNEGFQMNLWECSMNGYCYRFFYPKLTYRAYTENRRDIDAGWFLLGILTFISVGNSIIYIYLPNPSTRAGYDTGSIFKWSVTGLNSDLSFS